MGRKLILFLLAYVVWCLFDWIPDTDHLLVGIPVAAIVGLLMGDLVFQRSHLVWHPRRYLYFLFHYVPVFLWEVLKANIDVAYRAVHPQLLINPGIVKVKISLKSDIACTLLANSITLTPGTMSIDIDQEKSVLYVHWIDVRAAHDIEKATQIIVERFESILGKIFEEGTNDAND